MIIRIFVKVIIGLLALVGAYTLTIYVLTRLGVLTYNVTYGECKKPFEYLNGETISF